MFLRARSVLPLLGAAFLCAAAASYPGQDDNRREFTIRARDAGYEPSRIEVRQNEIVAIELIAESRPHTFTIDEYRIAKRARPGAPVRFEFRADRVGTFVYYCRLTGSDGEAHDLRGELVVRK
ncbi:MAG TPA: cupredoxin domain-containing protein [Vicinamibacterales bacterium]